MFKCSSYILSRAIWKMWMEIQLQISLISHIIVTFIVILTGTAFYGDSTVENKCLWLNFHVKFCLQWFITLTFCHHTLLLSAKKASLLIFCTHVFLAKKSILWYAYLFNIDWKCNFWNSPIEHEIFVRCFFFTYVGLLISTFDLSLIIHIFCIDLVRLELYHVLHILLDRHKQ